MPQKLINRDPLPSLSAEELAIFKKCSQDIDEFIKYVQIWAPKLGWINVDKNIFPKQRKILKDLELNWRKKYIVLLSPRQSGKTTLVLIFILWLITFTSSSNIGILANKRDNARKIFRRFSNMYRRLPSFFRLSKEVGDSKSELELADGTIVFASATSRSGLRSESITLLYLDEFAWLSTRELQQEFWQSNYPILESMSGGLIISSTPNGKDLFYDLYSKTRRLLNGVPNKDYDPKWVLEQIQWADVFHRDEKWKLQKIRDLSAGGKNGAEAFAQEYDNSFEIQAGIARFFNQDIIGRLPKIAPMREWVPHREYTGEPIKVYDQIGDQHFLIGLDTAEGKFLNFSTMIGLSVRKKQLKIDSDIPVYDVRQAFQWQHAGTLPDDFFDLAFQFLITQLNDKWFLCFEINDVGRNIQIRFENLLEEISSGEFSKKNLFFKEILHNKFEGDYEQMLGYLSRRVFRSTGRRGFSPYGLKTDRRNNVDLKNNLKTVVDKGNVTICDELLLEEMRLFEDKRGGETIHHQNYQGTSHFDLVQGLKFATWPMSDRNIMQDVFSINPLQDGSSTREQQFLEAVLRGNSGNSARDSLLNELENDNKREIEMQEGYPLQYGQGSIRDAGDITSFWNKSNLWRKRHK